ncbi:DUF1016 N-terminal domain-containing protein [Methanogenium marinum]|uniref:DUF1016 N-terminal domain-containing protein n=1 Tax=Methanogenium marinum TaxID=348610 RepID=A0A9Q4PXJ6_9EURY|nr:DUF1016 N-terminal domain-containing protein [Methanogenium marinum]MDE4907168.1 DUF1016 N-terminal domain-containing protein [Methanogenium marinum]
MTCGFKVRTASGTAKGAVSVNTALPEFYWQPGADSVEKQKSAAWGSGFLARPSHNLMAEFPEMKGFSGGNLKHIRRWYHFYSRELANLGTGCTRIESEGMPPANGDKNGAQAVHLLTQIPWGHTIR